MDRRRYLAASGALVGAAVGLTGCLGRDESRRETATQNESNEESADENGKRNTGGEFAAPLDGEYEDVARWLPAPSILETEPYAVQSITPAPMLTASESLDEATLEPLTDVFAELAVESPAVRDIDRLVTVRYGDVLSPIASSSLVVEGAIDPDAVGATLADAGYESVRRDAGYEFYGGERGDDAYAVADGVLLAGRGAGEARSIVERIADAERGTVSRYADENDGFRRLADALPAGHLSFAGPADSDADSTSNSDSEADADEPLGPAVAEGHATQVRGDETEAIAAIVLEEAATVDETDVAETLADGELDAATDPEYELDDGVVRVRWTRPTSEFEGEL